MSKTAFVFPGQGSQYIGMMKGFYDSYAEVRDIFDKSLEILDYDIKKIIFEGPEEKLRQTIVTQPAIFISSAVCIEVLKKVSQKIYDNCTVSAGHSLGEYSALYFAGTFDFSDGLKLVKKRAEFIHTVSQKSAGSMAAVVGMDENTLRELCEQVKQKTGVVEMVNFNTANQIVVSGIKEAVNELVNTVNSSGKAKAIPLNVSGAFHSSLMKEAADLMAMELGKVKINDLRIPVIANYDAEYTTKAQDIKNKLVKQIYNPVLWLKSMEKIMASGVDTFIELGPGKVLSGMLRKINRSIKIFNVEDTKSLESLVTEL